MKYYLPFGFIAFMISIYYFRETNRVRKARREERREQLNERRQEILDRVVKAKKSSEDLTGTSTDI